MIESFINLAKSRKRASGEKEIEEGRKLQEEIIETLEGMRSDKVYKNRDEFIEILDKALEEKEIKIRKPVKCYPQCFRRKR